MNADNVNTVADTECQYWCRYWLVLLIVEIGQNTEMMRAQINQKQNRHSIISATCNV